ncbi:MAG: hypothetical protein U9R37_03285 [Campylobacterota bacterium]|nr:hypothetical protein [Campylobacterota bacterium]
MNDKQNEIEKNEIDPKEEKREEVFEKLKYEFIEEQRLIGRFYDFCSQYHNFEYDEMGINMEEGEDILRKTNVIKDKILNRASEKLLYIFENVEINTIANIISFDLDTKEYQYKVVLEVMSDSFNLEVI